MRHGKRNNALSRTASHRKAMLSNMACSLVEHKRITTTVAKAKALRKFVEPLITKSKTDSTHSRRVVFSNLKSKDAVNELFREVAPKVATREGGYTRIIKTGTRLGDAAEMCMIELVDFNELMLKESKTKTRRSRRGGKKGSSAPTEAKTDAPKTEAAAPAKDAEAKAEDVKADDSAAKAEKPAEPKAEKASEPKAQDAVEAKEEKSEAPKKAETSDAKPEEKADDAKPEPKPEAKKEEDKKEDDKDSDDKKK
ncbi:MAG TPA: 50S ribosomal protein L17 [Cryomorphaceae bacterium]|nr:50S ribosomal protein L17 [Cryomorphaceae bacterium]